MLKYFMIFLLAISFVGCDDDTMDDDNQAVAPVYSIAIMSPDATDKKVGESIHIHVNFDEAEAGTIHHANVQIVKDDGSVIMFEGPSEAHVHEESGHYELHADVVLDDTNNVTGHTDWILKAKVWGHEAGAAEVEEELEFHVHPE